MAVSVSIIAIMLIFLFRKNRNLREFWTILASITKFVIIASMVPTVLDGNTLSFTLFSIPYQISVAFKVDVFGLLFGLIASFLWIMTSLYSIGYMRSLNEHAQTRYFVCFAIALSSTIGIAFSANLFTLFIFYEILTLSTYPLVIHKETHKAKGAGRKYLVYTIGGSVILLFGIVVTYSLTGNLDFVSSGILNENSAPSFILKLLFAIFIAGFGVKSAFMPLHSWLPSAMVAPTPVSALLHAVAVVKAGIFGVLRVIYFIFGVDLLSSLGIGIYLAYFVSFTIIVASLFAILQDNLKKRLAYSTISQLSYIALGAALLNHAGLIGSALHIVYHAFMKITLFFCAGAIFVVTKKENISELNGVGRRMPITMLMFFIAILGMCGFPPSCGFISKWFLIMGSVNAGQLPLAFVLLGSALLNVAYFFPIIFRAFFKKPKEKTKFEEAPLSMLIPLILTAIISLILGIWPDTLHPIFQIVETMAGGVI